MSKLQSEKFLGIDVSKNELVIYNPVNNRTYLIKNTTKAIKTFIVKVAGFGIRKMILESSGGYDYPVLLAFQNAGYQIYRINPKYIKAFARSFGDKAKTDKIDSKLISLYGEKINPLPIKINTQQEELRMLMNRREQIVTAIVKERQYKSTIFDNKLILKSIENHLQYLNKELENINLILDQTIAENEELNHKEKLLSSCIGIGKISSKALIAYLPELGQINNNQIASLVGVAPKNFDSGNFTGKRQIIGGGKNIRNILYMCSMSLIKHKNNRFFKFYQKLLHHGKAKKIAIIALIKKLITTLNSMVRTNKAYNENYLWNNN